MHLGQRLIQPLKHSPPRLGLMNIRSTVASRSSRHLLSNRGQHQPQPYAQNPLIEKPWNRLCVERCHVCHGGFSGCLCFTNLENDLVQRLPSVGLGWMKPKSAAKYRWNRKPRPGQATQDDAGQRSLETPGFEQWQAPGAHEPAHWSQGRRQTAVQQMALGQRTGAVAIM